MRKFLITTLLLTFAIAILAYFFYPFSLPPGENYFKPIGKRTLQKDEIGQFNYVYETYSIMDITGDEFPGWDVSEQLRWRYGIAFASYSVPSIVIISKDHASKAKHLMQIMIKKMKSKRVWGDWIAYGMGEDPISEGNIMYKAHLNLMYGLYHLITGSEEFSLEYTWLTNKIVDEMRRHHLEGKHEGADCEPGRYFAQCNSITLLSLKIYDKLYGTNYSEEEAKWTISFIKDKMVDKKYGFYHKMYSTDMGYSNTLLSGYTNAWTMTFLRSYEKDYNDALYPVWKKYFTKEIGPFAYVREDHEAKASPLATMTGMIAAKEFNDISLFTKLRNSVDRNLYQKQDAHHYIYKGINNEIYNGPILWTKVHLGWETILNYDWGHDQIYKIPDVKEMNWKDILDQKILLMSTYEENQL
ncbi:MAG: hypothetical protein VX325_05955 [Bacteroidota bacterium]|nr:hypothetical protein [Bacteroidota bacterium]